MKIIKKYAIYLASVLCVLCQNGWAQEVEPVAVPPPVETSTEITPAGYAINFGQSKPKFHVVPYGSLWGNMIYSTQRTNPGPFTLFVLSEEDQGEDTFHVDARRSRFGLNVSGPELSIFDGMQSGGRVEVDFIGEFVASNNAHARLRHVYWEAKDERQQILIGQTWDIISPLNPRTVNFSVGWLSGNIGFRRAQFRYERYGKFSEDLTWALQSSLNEAITPDFPTNPGVAQESSNYPVIEARASLKLNPQAGARATTLGVSGHIGETGFDFLVDGPPPVNLPPEDDARFKTWSYNLDLSFPIGSRTHLQAEFFHGRNLSPFLGGIGQGVCACTRTAITSTGSWFDLQYEWTDWLSSHIGSGIDDPVDSDFIRGRTSNHFIFTNVIVMLTETLRTGLEVSYWRTLYQDTRGGLIDPDDLGPTGPGEAVTIDWMVKYDF